MQARSPKLRRACLAAAFAAAFAGIPPVALADSVAVPIEATVLSRARCIFSSNAALNLNFGTINPLDTDPKTVSTTTSFRCLGRGLNLFFAVSADDGDHALFPGQRRMQHTGSPTNHLPYTLSVSPTSGSVLVVFESRVVTVSATVAPAHYRNARVGPYSDTVVLTVNP